MANFTQPAPAPRIAAPPQALPQQPSAIPRNGGRVPDPHVLANSFMQASQKVQQQGPKTQSPPPPRTPDQPKTTGILAHAGPITQRFGQPSQYDVFSKNVSPAHEIAVPTGTQLSTPPGEWKVVKAFDQANPQGHIGDFSGQGWGNNVRLQNTKTGETIGYNHMSAVNVKPGQVIQGGIPVGASGMSGNATGPHVAITYMNSQGKPQDFAQTPYAQYLFGGVQQGIQNIASGVGNVVSNIGNQLGQAFSGFSAPQPPPIPAPPQMNFTQEAAPEMPMTQTPRYVSYNPSAQLTAYPQYGGQGGGNPLADVVKGVQQYFNAPPKPLLSPVPESGKIALPLDEGGIRRKYGPGVHQVTPEEWAIIQKKPTSSPAPVQQQTLPAYIPPATASKNFKKLVEYAAKRAQEEGFHPAPIVSQLATESARGTSDIFKRTNNALGITAYDNSPGKSATRYKTPEASIDSYFKIMKSDPRYAQAYEKRSDPAAFVQAMAPTYASDPNYVQTLTNTPEWRQFTGTN